LLSTPNVEKTLTKKNLLELTKAVDPNAQLDDDVQEYLLNYAESYMEDVMEGACQLAAHRKGTTVDVKDVQTYLERSCGSWIPGFGADELKQFKRSPVTEAHKQRAALIKKTMKKY